MNLTTNFKLGWNGEKCTVSRMAYLQSVFPLVGITLATINGSVKFGSASRVWFDPFISAKDRCRDKSSAAVNWCSSIGFKNSVDLHQLMIRPSACNVQDLWLALSGIIGSDCVNFRVGKRFWWTGKSLLIGTTHKWVAWSSECSQLYLLTRLWREFVTSMII